MPRSLLLQPCDLQAHFDEHCLGHPLQLSHDTPRRWLFLPKVWIILCVFFVLVLEFSLGSMQLRDVTCTLFLQPPYPVASLGQRSRHGRKQVWIVVSTSSLCVCARARLRALVSVWFSVVFHRQLTSNLSVVYLWWAVVFGYCDLDPPFIARPGGMCDHNHSSVFMPQAANYSFFIIHSCSTLWSWISFQGMHVLVAIYVASAKGSRSAHKWGDAVMLINFVTTKTSCILLWF